MVGARGYLGLCLLTTVLALVVVGAGAWVRLTGAGLGCPDWPGCYGRVSVPESAGHVLIANLSYPERPLEHGKAWREMVHRYLAGALGIAIAALGVLAWRRRRMPGQALLVPLALVVLVILQALLGMLTVTLLLQPLVVTAHLLGGMLTLALLWWLCLRHGRLFLVQGHAVAVEGTRPLRAWAMVGLAVVVAQHALGAWTSANYAGFACPDVPTCHGVWWPAMSFAEGFGSWPQAAATYEGGTLSHEARAAIHVAHRLGAMATVLYIAWLSILAVRARHASLALAGVVTLLLVAAQAGLGVATVVLGLPLALAVAHNVGAAMLLLAVVTLNHLLRPSPVVL